MYHTEWLIVWAVAIILFGIVEGITVQLVSIWFVVGAAAALVAALCGAHVAVQVFVFIAVSCAALLLTRPLKRRIQPNPCSTNADRCIGQQALVIQRIDNLASTGQVKLGGSVWTARSAGGEIIEVDKKVNVKQIDGVKLIVTPQKE